VKKPTKKELLTYLSTPKTLYL